MDDTDMPDRADVEGLIVDAVGTLIFAEPSVSAAYLGAASRQGLAFDPSEIRARFRRHFGEAEQEDRRDGLKTDEARERRRWRQIVANVLPELPDPDRAFEELWDHFGQPTAWRCFEDVGPALRDLDRADLPILIGSNFDTRLRRVALGLPEIAAWAESAVISSEVGYRKPHPSFFLAACDRLGLPPGRVLCVGDDPENDLHGPIRSGLRAILIDRDDTSPRVKPRLPDLRILATRLTGRRER